MGLFSSIRGRLKRSGTQADTYNSGALVDFIDSTGKVRHGTVWRAIGGCSWQNYYIETKTGKCYLIGEPMIRLSQRLPQTKASTKAHKNAKEA